MALQMTVINLPSEAFVQETSALSVMVEAEYSSEMLIFTTTCILQTYTQMTFFWDVEPSGIVEIDLRFRGTSVLRYVVSFYHTTRHNIPEDSHLHIRGRENFKSHVYAELHKYLILMCLKITICHVVTTWGALRNKKLVQVQNMFNLPSQSNWTNSQEPI
jgi:hypothetical protein